MLPSKEQGSLQMGLSQGPCHGEVIPGYPGGPWMPSRERQGVTDEAEAGVMGHNSRKAPSPQGKATHSSILAWRIPRTESPRGRKEPDATEQFSRHRPPEAGRGEILSKNPLLPPPADTSISSRRYWFQTSALQKGQNVFPLISASEFVVICYSSYKKLIQNFKKIRKYLCL